MNINLNFPFFTQTSRHTLPYNCPAFLFSPCYSEPGSADAVCTALGDINPEAALLGNSFLSYYRGDITTAVKLAKQLLEQGCCLDSQIGACHILSLEALYHGNIENWKRAKQYLSDIQTDNPEDAAILSLSLAATDNFLFVNGSFPEEFKRGCFDAFPKDYYPCLRYLYVKYLFMQFRYESLEAMVEPFISGAKINKEILSEIYLRIVAAMSYHSTGKNELAQVHIKEALNLAIPDGLFMPFIEARRNLGSILDDCLHQQAPETLKMVVQKHKVLQFGWTILFNQLYDTDFSTKLSTREYDVARFALGGMTNKEIAGYMEISVNTVKSYLQNIYNKLGISGRKEIAPFLWRDFYKD